MEKKALKEQNTQLQNLLNDTVFVLADRVENRVIGMDGHIERILASLKILVSAMFTRGVYTNELNKIDLGILYSSACLYDIGKISIPDSIICKPGRLTNDEFEIMKTHAMEGELIIDQIVSRTGEDVEYLRSAKLLAGYHHERWDGKGYPRGLDRLNIPLQGRIMAVLDVYDALVSTRSYKKPFTPEESVKIIMDSTGEMFDPLITEVFYDARKQFEKL
ncbi:MAG: HD domain-containing protein [Treponema sp.]|jgi:response regulator RpfG family c-di-GMP phosphodiesterase|nr:HD domain-containing protein [Treponema sp.]